MDAGSFHGLAASVSCTFPCCSLQEQLQLVPSSGSLKALVGPGRALRHHARHSRRHRGTNSAVVRAAVAHDLAAVAVAAAAVLPVCWMYANRSQLWAESTSIQGSFPSSVQEEEPSAGSASAYSSIALVESLTSPATRSNGAVNGEVKGVLPNNSPQSSVIGSKDGKVEDQWLGASNHEHVLASIASVSTVGIRFAEDGTSLGVASSRTAACLETNVHDAAIGSLPNHRADPRSSELLGLFLPAWDAEVSQDFDDELLFNEERAKSGSLASTPEVAYGEGNKHRDETSHTVEAEIPLEDCTDMTAINGSVPVEDRLILDQPSHTRNTNSTLESPGLALNGKASNLKFELEGAAAIGEASKTNDVLKLDGVSNGSSRADVLKLESRAKDMDGIADVSLSDEETTMEMVDERDGVTGNNKGTISATVLHSHENPSMTRDPADVTNPLSRRREGPRPLNGRRHRSESAESERRSKRKVKQGKSESSTRASPFFPRSILEILPLDESAAPIVYLKIYKSLLRAGRVRDCVVLLEEMDKLELLDTDQIYHSNFFKSCQNQRAVKEAFRFMRLLRRPTLSTYNMLLCVCREARDVDGGLRVLSATENAGFKPDTILYTTLISTCAKAANVDVAFKVFHDMQTAGVVTTKETYSAMIDCCAIAGQIAKAFGVYGIMISKQVKADRVVFNSLVKACGRAGAIERAFDVLADMKAEPYFLKPNHVTIGALISACARAGQVDRAFEVYENMQEWGIQGTAECYTAVVHACSASGDLDRALGVFGDMQRDGVIADEIFFCALIDTAGHSKRVDTAFSILDEMKKVNVTPAAATYSTLMGVCCNTGNWERGLELYRTIRAANFLPTGSTFNALITALCDAKHLDQAFVVFNEMKEARVRADKITYSILLDACEKLDAPERALDLYSSGRAEGVVPNEAMCASVIGICHAKINKERYLRGYQCSFGFFTRQNNEAHYERWSSWAVAAYRHAIAANVIPKIKSFALLLGCLRIPESTAEKNLFDDTVSHLGSTRFRPLFSLEGAGLYDPRAITFFEEAASMGVVPNLNYAAGPVTLQAESMPSYVAEVYLLKLMKAIKQRHAAGAQLFPVTIYYSTETKKGLNPTNELLDIKVTGRTGQAVAALLRRLRLHFHGHESLGKLRIDTASIRNWLKTVSAFPNLQRHREVGHLAPRHAVLARGIAEQQQAIRMGTPFNSSRAEIERIPSNSSTTGMYESPRKASQGNHWGRRESTISIPAIELLPQDEVQMEGTRHSER